MPTRATPFDPAMRFNTAPIPAALGYLNPAIWVTTAMTSRTLSTTLAAITRLGCPMFGIAGAASTTATNRDVAKTHHAVVAAMPRLAAAALAVIMLAWMVAGALHYFDVLVK